MKHVTVIASVVLLSICAQIARAAENLDGAPGKVFRVNEAEKCFELLKETVFDPETGVGKSRHTVYWSDRTKFTKVSGKKGEVQTPAQAKDLLRGFWKATVRGSRIDGRFVLTGAEIVALPNPRTRDDPNLPRVLVIGDSISMNYHDSAKAALAGKANYYRIEGNGGPSDRGVSHMEMWLGDYTQPGLRWDVIQFNHGLHGLKQPYDKATDTWGEHQVALEDYKKNLAKEIEILQRTGATLIWCTTTPVPNSNFGRYARRKDEDLVFNKAALEVISQHPKIQVNDLNAFIRQSKAFDEWRKGTDDPNYKITTDWGALDGYHAPGRNPGNVFPRAKSAAWTLDAVESPRNSGWFLCALAARRALTFMEQQPEVDAERLGVYGHSMGGKLTVMASVDSRVRAAAPSCGGISDRYNKSDLFCATLGDDVSLKQISCPIIFLSPSNDFHGRIGDLPKAVAEINTDGWRVTCSPHHNHQDTPPFEVATMLWIDQHLKAGFALPKTPQTQLSLKTDGGVPMLSVRPDDSRQILSVDVFYTQHGKENETPQDHENTKRGSDAPMRIIGKHWKGPEPKFRNLRWTLPED